MCRCVCVCVRLCMCVHLCVCAVKWQKPSGRRCEKLSSSAGSVTRVQVRTGPSFPVATLQIFASSFGNAQNTFTTTTTSTRAASSLAGLASRTRTRTPPQTLALPCPQLTALQPQWLNSNCFCCVPSSVFLSALPFPFFPSSPFSAALASSSSSSAASCFFRSLHRHLFRMCQKLCKLHYGYLVRPFWIRPQPYTQSHTHTHKHMQMQGKLANSTAKSKLLPLILFASKFCFYWQHPVNCTEDGVACTRQKCDSMNCTQCFWLLIDFDKSTGYLSTHQGYLLPTAAMF